MCQLGTENQAAVCSPEPVITEISKLYLAPGSPMSTQILKMLQATSLCRHNCVSSHCTIIMCTRKLPSDQPALQVNDKMTSCSCATLSFRGLSVATRRLQEGLRLMTPWTIMELISRV